MWVLVVKHVGFVAGRIVLNYFLIVPELYALNGPVLTYVFCEIFSRGAVVKTQVSGNALYVVILKFIRQGVE